MLAASSRTIRALTATGVLMTLTSAASAQFMDPCAPCAQPAPPVACNPCPCLQPVHETVYREVPVIKYRTVERTVQKPIIRTKYEDREVTAYRTINETRTAEVPGISYQQCTECRQMTVNRSYWVTHYQPVCKVSPCQYDPSPTFMGELNRLGYGMRMAFTPNYIPRRQFVPNVVAYNVPSTRTVAIPTTRQVTYNVARLEPYTTTQRVAVQKMEYVDATVTAYEPYTEMRTVAVGTATRYALVDPSGRTATAARPTPATADGETVKKRTAEADGSTRESRQDTHARPLSYPRPKPEPTAEPQYREANNRTAPRPQAAAPTSAATTQAGGWRASRSAGIPVVASPISLATN